MRRHVLALIVALATMAALSPISLAAPGGPTPVIVVLRDGAGTPGDVAEALGRAHGFAVSNVYQHALRGFAATVPAGRLAALRADPRVAYVELDQIVYSTDQVTPTGIARAFAPGNPNIDIDGTDDHRVDVDVAVIDTGIDLDHPDLNVVASTNCSGGGPFKKSCGSGGNDDNGHGTHVAGTIGALDNGIGVVGVAPGARLWAVKVLSSSGSGYINWIVAGIDFVTANAGSIEVANMSLGCECSSAAMDTAIANSVAAGVVYAVAAGNNDKNASTFSPANHPDVITVSALADFNGLAGGGATPTCRVDQDDTLADFSNWGATVEIAAPGVCILSTWPGGGYDTISGTSMASPHVAGAAALLASRNNPANRSDTQTIRSTLVNNGNLNWTDDSGDGIKERLLDVSNASVFNPVLVAGAGGGGGGGGNSAPIANDDAYSVTVGQTLNVAAPGVLGNDTDADGNDLAAILVATAGQGSLMLNANGSFSYTPSNDVDTSFTYKANDGTADSNTATVSITVNPAPSGTSMHAGDLDGSATSSGNQWSATVNVRIHDAGHNPVANSTVFFSWSGGHSASSSCMTDTTGACAASTPNIHKRNGSVTFTVTNVSHASLTYASTDNHDPDGDSDGTSIVVSKP